jgi:hypothetical protein
MATLSISSQTSLLNPANFLVFALYDSTAPSVLLEKIAPPKPYGNPLQVMFTFNCLNGHVYIFKLWESPDDTATGVVRNSSDVTVNGNTVKIKADEYPCVGVTPGLDAGTTVYDNTDWAGWNYNVERIGSGTMRPEGYPDVSQPNYRQLTTGGMELLDPEVTFQPDEKFCVRFLPQVVVAPPPGTPSGLFGTGRIITADETLTIDDVGQALQLQSDSTTLNITLPLLADVADFSFLYFFSSGGSHLNASLIAGGTDTILFPTGLNRLILGQCETAMLYKAFGVWNVCGDLQGVLNVGELVLGYGKNIARTKPSGINLIPMSGQLISRTDYPRLWAWVQTLEAACVVTDTQWTSTTVTVDGVTYYTKKGCFSTGDGSTTFRLPLLTNDFLRTVDGSARFPGPIELQTIQAHSHKVITGGIGGFGADPGKSLGRQNYNGDAYQDGASSLGTYIQATGSTETKPTNRGVYALIRF